MTTLRSLDEVVRVIDAASSPGRRTLIAIAGSPGAGKSTIATQVVELLGDAALVAMDGFHLPPERLVELGRRDRMGAPDTFDVEGFIATLSALRRHGNSGELLRVPGFDRKNERPIPEAECISPEFSRVVVEGNYLLLDSGGWERALPFFDLTFFVRVDHSIRLDRLIARHEEFGKTPAEALAWTTGSDERNSQLIEATAVRADHVIQLG